MKALKINPCIIDRDPAVATYLKEISKYPQLSVPEEEALAYRALQGDETARQRLVTANLRFVVSVAAQYHCPFLQLLDLVSEGNAGLVRAAQSFNPSQGFRFISYAVFWIRHYIQKAICHHARQIRLSEGRVKALQQMLAFADEFEAQHERKPTIGETSDAMGIAEDVINDILAADTPPLSLNATPGGRDGGPCLAEAIADESQPPIEDIMTQALCHALLTEAVAQELDPREQQIVAQHFGIGTPPLKIVEIAARHHLSRERVRQLLNDALDKLRHSPLLQQLQEQE